MAGELRYPAAVDLIGRANFDLFQIAEHVEQHDCETIDAAEPGRIARGHRVEPAAAARAASDRAVFIAAIADVLADRVVLLGRKRPAADASGIGLERRRSPS